MPEARVIPLRPDDDESYVPTAVPPGWEEQLAGGLEFLRRRLTGEYETDEFGFDPDLADHVLLPILRPLFNSWFRVETQGLENVPDVGGALTQWHVHSDLCLTDNPEQKVLAGFTFGGQSCPAGTTKAGNTPMLHVWIVPNRCGPFAALEGIGGGQIPPGQTRLCDTAHGLPTS